MSINVYLFKDPNFMKLTFISDPESIAIALPESIYISTGFIKKSEEILSYGETAAVICHEASHILNDDWGNRITKENSSYNLDYKEEIRIEGYATSNLGYKWSKLFNKKITKDEYREMAKADFELKTSRLSRSSEKNPYVLGKSVKEGGFSLGKITDSQGFSIETEYFSDRMTIGCLENLDFKKNAILSLLFKLRDQFGPNVDRIRIQKRILKAEGHLR